MTLAWKTAEDNDTNGNGAEDNAAKKTVTKALAKRRPFAPGVCLGRAAGAFGI